MATTITPQNVEFLLDEIRHSFDNSLKTAICGSGSTSLPSADDCDKIVFMSHLDRIIEVRKQDFSITAEAGIPLYRIMETAESEGLWFGRMTGLGSTLGGRWMAGGLAFHGTRGQLRRTVTGASIITAEGEKINAGGLTEKNVTGYDLTRFFAGTLGMYGIVTELILKADPVPEKRVTIRAHSETMDTTAKMLRKFFELHSNLSSFIVNFPEGIRGKADMEIGIDGMAWQVEKTLEVSEKILSDMRTAYSIQDYDLKGSSAEKYISPSSYFTFSVPFRKSPELLKVITNVSPESPVFGFPLEGRFHVFDIFEEEMAVVGEKCLNMDGKIPFSSSYLKKQGIDHLFSTSEMELIQKLKRELDTKGILNPHLGIS